MCGLGDELVGGGGGAGVRERDIGRMGDKSKKQ